MKTRKTLRQRTVKTVDLRTLAVRLLFTAPLEKLLLFAEESESVWQNQRCVWILCQNLASPSPYILPSILKNKQAPIITGNAPNDKTGGIMAVVCSKKCPIPLT